MNSTSCWNSISCLERWSLWLQWGVVISGVVGTFVGGGIIGGLLAAFLGVGLLWLHHRIVVLKAPRTFTPEQEQAITNSLRGKLPASFVIKAYAPSADSSEYGSNLEKILVDMGWDSIVSEHFHTRGGEVPPTGINIMVDGLHAETVTIGRQLEEALRTAQVEDVKFVIDENLREVFASTWVLIKVGRKANL